MIPGSSSGSKYSQTYDCSNMEVQRKYHGISHYYESSGVLLGQILDIVSPSLLKYAHAKLNTQVLRIFSPSSFHRFRSGFWHLTSIYICSVLKKFTINPARLSNTGLYHCRATNKFGSSKIADFDFDKILMGFVIYN